MKTSNDNSQEIQLDDSWSVIYSIAKDGGGDGGGDGDGCGDGGSNSSSGDNGCTGNSSPA